MNEPWMPVHPTASINTWPIALAEANRFAAETGLVYSVERVTEDLFADDQKVGQTSHWYVSPTDERVHYRWLKRVQPWKIQESA